MQRIRDFVTALRSGEYAQCSDLLSITRDGVREYCCEGVALERHGEALGYDVFRNDEGTLRGRDPVQKYSEGSALVAPTRFWADMGLAGPGESFKFTFPGGMHARGDDDQDPVISYTDLNDNGLTFEQIADLIEWQFLACPRD